MDTNVSPSRTAHILDVELALLLTIPHFKMPPRDGVVTEDDAVLGATIIRRGGKGENGGMGYSS